MDSSTVICTLPTYRAHCYAVGLCIAGKVRPGLALMFQSSVFVVSVSPQLLLSEPQP